MKSVWIIVTWAVGMNAPPGGMGMMPFPGQMSPEVSAPATTSWLKPDNTEAPSAFFSEDACKKALAELWAIRGSGGGTPVYQRQSECLKARIESE